MIPMSRWIEVECAGGCGRTLAADRDSVEKGALVFCTWDEPSDLPFSIEYDGVGTS